MTTTKARVREVSRAEVQDLVAHGAQLVDVLPAEEYGEEHLVGSVSIPLRELGRRARSELDPSRPVVVYCFDSACDLSPRAARRLLALGFEQVYDYVAGQADWAAAGLPTEGTALSDKRIGAVADKDVPRCRPGERVGEVAERLADWELAVVVDDDEVVMGRVIRSDLDGEGVVEDVMREGPSTYRPNVPVTELAERFDEHHVHRALVTTSDGRLVGLVRRTDL